MARTGIRPRSLCSAASRAAAWAARLSRRPGHTSPAETAAYLAAKAGLLDRIAASREQDGWTRDDIDTARQAAAAARQAAITALEEQS